MKHQAILDWCNEVRATRGKIALPAMVTGMPQSPCECTIANTIGDCSVTPGTHRFPKDEGHVIFKNPKFVEQFIYDFDDGKYPELIENG